MAIEKWATDAAAGGGSGDSILDPYTLAEMLAFVNGDDPPTDHIFAYLCGDFTLGAQLVPNVRRPPDKRLIFQGRDLATGSIDQLITIDADGQTFFIGVLRQMGGVGNNHTLWRHVRITNSGEGTAGFYVSGSIHGVCFFHCQADNVDEAFHSGLTNQNSSLLVYKGLADSCRSSATSFGNAHGSAVDSVAKNCDFGFTSLATAHRCLAVNCGAFPIRLNWNKVASHLTVYLSATGSGIRADGASPQFIAHCFSQEAEVFGLAFPGVGSNYTQEIYRFAGALNASGRIDTPSPEAPVFDELPITATADCFNDKGAEDFGLNEDLNGGVLLKNIDGIAFPRGTTISYHAAGAVESPQAAGPGGGIPFPGNYTNKGVH